MRLPNFDTPEARGSPEPADAIVIALSGSDGGPDANAGAAVDRLRAALTGRAPAIVIGDAAAVGPCSIGTVDLVARLALAARQGGCRLVLRDAPVELRELLALAGLADVVPCAEDSVEPER